MMEKRKRRADHSKTPNPPTDSNPPSSQTDSLSEQKCSNQAYVNEAHPSSSTMDCVDVPLEVSQVPPLPNHQDPNCSSGIVLKHPRHPDSRQYSRKRRSNHGDTSTLTGKVTPQQGRKLSFKLSSKPNPDFPGCIAENKEKLFCPQEKTRDGLLTKDGSSSEMVCGLCEKRLRKKPNVFDHSSSSGEVLVAAVLVCGHVYHSDCLEQRTCHEDLRDPPCPLCASPIRDDDASLEHE